MRARTSLHAADAETDPIVSALVQDTRALAQAELLQVTAFKGDGFITEHVIATIAMVDQHDNCLLWTALLLFAESCPQKTPEQALVDIIVRVKALMPADIIVRVKALMPANIRVDGAAASLPDFKITEHIIQMNLCKLM